MEVWTEWLALKARLILAWGEASGELHRQRTRCIRKRRGSCVFGPTARLTCPHCLRLQALQAGTSPG